MQIALVYDAVYPFVAGGVERRNYSVAEVLRQRHKVAIYGFHYWPHDEQACLTGCRYVPVGRPIPLYHPDGRRRIGEAIVFAGRLFAALLASREEVWDVANFPFFSVPAAWLASRMRRRKLIVTWHEYWGDYWYQYLGWRGFFGKLVEKLALACSPRIIAVSQHTRDRLVSAGYPRNRILVVPNGVDVCAVDRAPPSAESCGLIFVGRLLPHKRCQLAIEALSIIRNHIPTATLTVIGDGPERPRLMRLAARLHLTESVRFVGRLPSAADVYSHLKAGRVLVIPSEREGFGIAVIEGWACGLPSVVCRGTETALPELIDDDAKGRVAEPTAEAIAAACTTLLERQPGPFLSSLRDAAEAYDWRRIARRLESVYSESVSDQD